MITVQGNYFKIDTENTTYLFKVNPLGILEHIYYGKAIPNEKDYSFLEEGEGCGYGVMMKNDHYLAYLDHLSQECSFKGRGDTRELLLQINCDGDLECEFLYEGYEVIRGFEIPGLPSVRHKKETLAVHLKDEAKKLFLRLYYSTYPGTDVITRSSSLKNESGKKVTIDRLFSAQIDFDEDEFILKTFGGTWAKESVLQKRPLQHGVSKISSNNGHSSCVHSPFVVVEKPDCSLKSGDCYGFNLIYSGNHAEYFERNNLHKVRFLSGINDDSFSWDLRPGEEFFAPEATLCYSSGGENELTHQYHRFVREHIVRGEWQYKEHPVLINDWEALNFDFTEEKLLALAKKGKELGCELFVLDDGWFGNRDGDSSSLGDWRANLAKLPNGIGALADKIHEMGLLFGLWFEPEMVSKDSDLFRAHPEFALTHKDYEPLESRNQLVLDLANPAVVDYLIENVGEAIAKAKCDYVKWDCNRAISDYLSPSTSNQGETLHRYVLGLYRFLEAIMKRFPQILFESCAAGGERIDLGMLCYMPSFWASDDTEPYEREKIQESLLMCYPQSCIGAHVSASPNHQTLRESQIEDRFNVACIGAFGYELDLNELSDVDTKSVYEQITWYKENRRLLTFGDYYKISSIVESSRGQFVIVSPNQEEAIYFLGNKTFELYSSAAFLKPVHLDPGSVYEVEERRQNFDFYQVHGRVRNDSRALVGSDWKEKLKDVECLKSEKQVATVSGASLMNAGMRLDYEWGSGKLAKRLMLDYSTRIYKIKKKRNA